MCAAQQLDLHVVDKGGPAVPADGPADHLAQEGVQDDSPNEPASAGQPCEALSGVLPSRRSAMAISPAPAIGTVTEVAQ